MRSQKDLKNIVQKERLLSKIEPTKEEQKKEEVKEVSKKTTSNKPRV